MNRTTRCRPCKEGHHEKCASRTELRTGRTVKLEQDGFLCRCGCP